MGIQIALPSRPIRTVGTSIRLFARVGPDVRLKVPLLRGAEGTVLAGEGLLPSVSSQVVPEVSGHLTGVWAVGTVMGLVTVVAVTAAETLHGSGTREGSSSATTCLRLAIALRPHL